ncbi:hypothetical protein [Hahella ganghwensis]|uniref:hypothetical protein n=1 Tax=Hahella ganghwensis TaxID=286420 RepID=UPI00035CA104|nr:hypothetical protein [Hahella ganghwensis]
MKKLTADEFNEKFHEGQPVYFDNDFGQAEECYLRSEAWELGHGEPVVKVTGRTGGVLCERIRPRVEG